MSQAHSCRNLRASGLHGSLSPMYIVIMAHRQGKEAQSEINICHMMHINEPCLFAFAFNVFSTFFEFRVEHFLNLC